MTTLVVVALRGWSGHIQQFDLQIDLGFLKQMPSQNPKPEVDL